MNKPTLSIILPSIRPYNLERLYSSILEATIDSFELIVVGPYSLPRELEMYPNIKVFRDWGSPTRASQIGACLAEGKFLTWMADDGIYLPNSIDECISVLFEKEKALAIGEINYNIVSVKYIEGNTGSFSVSTQPDSFYKLNNAYPKSKNIKNEAYILNAGFLSRELFELFGGWDCQFEACPMAHADLAARFQYNNYCNIILLDKYVLKCDHLSERNGDHGPIHDAQIFSDTTKYIKKWDSKYINTHIDMSNWKDSPAIWERRFGTKNIN